MKKILLKKLALLHSAFGRHKSADEGSIVVETAVLLPLILFCGLGATEISMAYMQKSSVDELAISYAQIVAKKGGMITEQEIKTMLDKAEENSGLDDMQARGRVILTAVKGNATGQNPTRLWQRCSAQPSGRSLTSEFSSASPTMPAGAELEEDRTFVLAEVFYESKPVTGFYFKDTDSNGNRVVSLGSRKIEMVRDISLASTITDTGGAKASSSCS
jgi:hypothetical protein